MFSLPNTLIYLWEMISQIKLYTIWPTPNLAFCIHPWLDGGEQGCKAKSLLVVIPIFHSFSSLLCGIMLWTRSEHCPSLFLFFYFLPLSVPCLQFSPQANAETGPSSRAGGDGNIYTRTPAKLIASAVSLLTWSLDQFIKGDVTLQFIHVMPSFTRGYPELAC